LQWSQRGELKLAEVCEQDHLDRLPTDTTAVAFGGIPGCESCEYRVGDAELAKLQRLPQLRYLEVAVPISDQGFIAISELPQLESLVLFSFYHVNRERLKRLEKLQTLKTLKLHVSESMLDRAALEAFSQARPDVTVVHKH
jgi:hypothetical protein